MAPTAEFTLTLQALVTTTGVDSKSFSLELLKDQERDNPWIVAHWNLDFSGALRGGHIPFISALCPLITFTRTATLGAQSSQAS